MYLDWSLVLQCNTICYGYLISRAGSRFMNRIGKCIRIGDGAEDEVDNPGPLLKTIQHGKVTSLARFRLKEHSYDRLKQISISFHSTPIQSAPPRAARLGPYVPSLPARLCIQILKDGQKSCVLIFYIIFPRGFLPLPIPAMQTQLTW